MLSGLNMLKNEKLTIDENVAKYQNSQKQYDSLTSEIERLRNEKNAIIFNANLGIENIAIEDDGIYYIVAGNKYLLIEEQVSTSAAMMVCAKILILSNKETNILLLGRAESLDAKNLNKILDFATQHGFCVFVDKVIEEGEFSIELIEGFDSTTERETVDAIPTEVKQNPVATKEAVKTPEIVPNKEQVTKGNTIEGLF